MREDKNVKKQERREHQSGSRFRDVLFVSSPSALSAFSASPRERWGSAFLPLRLSRVWREVPGERAIPTVDDARSGQALSACSAGAPLAAG